MTAPATKPRTGMIVGIVVTIAALLACTGIAGITVALRIWSGDEPLVARAGHVIQYEVHGTGDAFLNWGKGTGGQEGSDAVLPFRKEIIVEAANFGLIISATPRGRDTKIVSCHILVDGVEVKRAEARNGLATCAFTYVGKR